MDFSRDCLSSDLLYTYNAIIYGLYSIIGFILLSVIVFGTLFVYEHFFWTKKIKDVRKKHVVVTGGSSGIGKCVAILAAKKGANVTIIARNVQNLEKAKREILQACENKDTQRVEYLSLDIGTDYDTVEKALVNLENDMGPIYMLANCAGLAIPSKIEDTTPKNLDIMMRTNFLGTYYCIKAVTPRMKAAKEGVIVLVSSQAGLLGIFGYTAYCSTKFAIRGLAESLAMELQPYNISVTLCLPPDTDTPGYAIEELSKPIETKAISQVAKLVQPEVVADKLFEDALASNFFSSVGFEGFIMMTLCAGMSPVKLFRQLFVQVFLMGPLRLIGVMYLFIFQRIIAQCKQHTNSENIEKVK
ncbi:PREDICTED: 3-ketodihydrosphingosine reductase [Cyphomyrmex costatus]|uniref:3-dehydrosphinganine reductase n=1 Tax=Cyphomyrmex costatus TaxID=456900 RepID=A0A195CR02_9HYME|nr:PREDICTED: 3-ketodihydrosphingosine reductase [Cyphomyrmex costatus]KYN03131.1 3-ketodihydrosphingosine reductase [Cyphomyrmex costatus]